MTFSKKKLILITFSLAILIILPNTVSTMELVKKEIKTNIEKIIDKASIEINDNVTILYLNGSYYEMGYQQGSLLKDQVQQNLRAILNFAEKKGITYDELLNIWNIMKNYVPQEYLDEMQGLADSIGFTFEEVNVINMLPTRLGIEIFACSGFSAWGSSTSDDRLIQGRSYDYPSWMKDPISGKYIQENQVLVVRKPDGKHASLTPAVAGLYGSGGFNDKNIGISLLNSWSKDNSYHGNPIRFKIPMVLDNADSVDEAIDILLSNRTLGYNIIVSDAERNVGFVVEQTRNFTYVGSWDNPTESNYPFYSMENIVRRTNLFVNSDTALTQRKRYNPSSLFLMLFGKNDYYPTFIQYSALSKGFEKHWGNLDLYKTMDVLREAYSGRNKLIIFLLHRIGFIDNIASYYGFLEAINQWVAYPETGDILISFADAEKRAWENEIHQFNFYELLGQ